MNINPMNMATNDQMAPAKPPLFKPNKLTLQNTITHKPTALYLGVSWTVFAYMNWASHEFMSTTLKPIIEIIRKLRYSNAVRDGAGIGDPRTVYIRSAPVFCPIDTYRSCRSQKEGSHHRARFSSPAGHGPQLQHQRAHRSCCF